MPPRPHRPDALAWQVFRGSDAVLRGLLTEHQLRSSAWVRLRHDIYADARLDRDHALTCRAALLRLPPGVVIAGPSAAYLHGVEHASAFLGEVHVLVPRSLRVGAQRGLRVHAGDFVAPTAADAQASGGRLVGAGQRPGAAEGDGSPRCSGIIPRTDPGRAAWETAVWLEPVRAVGIVDALLRQGLTDRDTLAEVATRNADRPGGRRARWVFELADPGAQSPPESQLRVRLVLAGLPRPVAQHPVRLPNGLILHPDLVWPEYRVAVEYDGQWHADADQLHRDRRRLNLLVGAGWLVLHVTSRRLHNDFPGVLREVRAALDTRGWRR
ncbi:DUF559 domain-containing protein [Micromonospora sp. GCM10011542]|uniref:DUF559 domain-containing protein n=1 Tax=Micromonospora sp. GCM10011542 TaxID=3317337 RepID=UPI00361DFAC3